MRSRIPCPLLVLLAACVVVGLPANGGLAHAQTPASTLKVPQNYDECYDLFGDLMAQWSDNMVGSEYQKFLQQTNFDHLIPDLCKQGRYQQVYNIAKGFLDAPSAPPVQQRCEMSETVGGWTAYANENGYRMITQGQITLAPDNPATAAPPSGPFGPPSGPVRPPPKLTAQFSIDARGAVGTGSVTRSYTVTYEFGWNPAPAAVDVTLTPDSGGTRRASTKVSGNNVDVTPAFDQPGSSSAIPEYGFGKKVQLKIDSRGTTLLTMDILFDGLSSAEHDATLAHTKYAELSGLSRCAAHVGSAPRRPVRRP